MKDINSIVSRNIRKFCLQKGLRQEKLAFASRLHRAYIGQIERGEKNIGLTNLQKIAETMKIDIKNFFD